MIQIDMPMPKCCDECFALDDHGDYPFCLISQDQRGYTFNVRENRMPTCPLKAQEPHILTPEEFDENKMVDAEGCIPCWVEYNRIDETWREWWANDYDGWLCLNKDDIVRINGEMDSQRIWSSKPTDEQMEVTPWG